MASLETKLQKQFDLTLKDKAKAKLILPKFMKVLDTQTNLYSAVHILTKGSEFGLPEKAPKSSVIGKIDVIFRYKGNNYVCEIKDSNPNNVCFWYAAKANAYCEYLKWQEDTNDYKPAVLIPVNALKLEYQIIAGKMGMGLFVFSFNEVTGEFTVKMVADTPHWKQNL